ncbi:MAG TPA: translation elongation factor 4 [Spirochaetota bacterium]|nr:translation elongation factor 4 [Spirochaetota bacterium]
MTDRTRIRNFSIIAHIDHGKSTLADRMLEETGILASGKHDAQVLDNMELEKERGITIKSQTVCMPFTAADGNAYILNLIDTPGHVDFSYEVSRALASCEGAVLLVDASQGVEAQTLANMYLAMEHNLKIIPVINKIDLPSANIPMVMHQIEHELGFDGAEVLQASAKAGIGIREILQAIVERIPAPTGSPDDRLAALLFDSKYDSYRGAIITARVFTGTARVGDTVTLMQTGQRHEISELGVHKIGFESRKELVAGEVGYIVAGIKTVSDTRIGDTMTHADAPCAGPLAGFRDVKPMVFASIYPTKSEEYNSLKAAMEKLKLNDASLVYEPDSSQALGFGFRCGFLGLLHLEIVQERLEREFDQDIIITSPTVEYEVYMNNGKMEIIDNPVKFPDPQYIEHCAEPFVKATVITPAEFMGNIIPLCLEKRGTQRHMEYLDEKRVEIIFDMPLAEIVYDFYDRLKSVSRGYASFDYEITSYEPAELVRVDILVNAKQVDALSQLVVRQGAALRGRQIVERLKDLIPRHQFKIPLQAAIGGSIIARETIGSVGKNVTAKCYGGDISRKRKLLEKQKEGKKRMKMFGNVEIPQSAFTEVLKTPDK